ncbi:hypothetical protein ACJX0J_005548, partial [Zea mays]
GGLYNLPYFKVGAKKRLNIPSMVLLPVSLLLLGISMGAVAFSEALLGRCLNESNLDFFFQTSTPLIDQSTALRAISLSILEYRVGATGTLDLDNLPSGLGTTCFILNERQWLLKFIDFIINDKFDASKTEINFDQKNSIFNIIYLYRVCY